MSKESWRGCSAVLTINHSEQIMYLTKNLATGRESDFDWESYFVNKRGDTLTEDQESAIAFSETRQHLRENQVLFGFIFHRFMKALLAPVSLKKGLRTLELGAATGFLSRWLYEQYCAHSTLVDRSEQAYNTFLVHNQPSAYSFEYLRADIFQLQLQVNYDVVCSFGVIEHFPEKKEILDIHKRFLVPGGYVLVIVPFDSPLTRAFYEINFELNQGYRELLTEKEFLATLQAEELTTVQVVRSQGYVYDIIGALCTVNNVK